ncbi:MAG TPA: HipA domain-containing protein, partial [Fimbriimonas sp.]|nr:HipA domain-containing protein [Fimbriimonas sp.]
DRVKSGEGEMQMLHIEDMMQAMNLFSNAKYSVDFAEICQAMTDVGVSMAGILEAIKLYAFSYMIGNGDLHGKNVSLMRGSRGQWMLTPAYDLVCTLPYKNLPPVMSVALFDETIGGFKSGDFVAFGAKFGVPEAAVQKEVRTLANKVVANLRLLAGAIPAEDIREIQERATAMS